MGNCQATDVAAAAAVIEHPDGSLHKLYWPTTAGDVMRSHPGFYVALVTFHISGGETANTSNTTGGGGSLRLIRVRLLKHKDLLLMGRAYRLVTSQEVAKALQARKQERNMKVEAELMKQREQEQDKQRQQQSAGVEGRGQVVDSAKRWKVVVCGGNKHLWQAAADVSGCGNK